VAKTLENTDSLGMSIRDSNPQRSLKWLSDWSRSMRCFVVGMPKKALAMKALRIELRDFGGRPVQHCSGRGSFWERIVCRIYESLKRFLGMGPASCARSGKKVR